MQREIDDYRRALTKRYVRSKRHTIQVDFLEHIAELAKERSAGAKRRGQSRALAVPDANRVAV
jgi:NADPH-dependent ferric siderophore reductase